MDNTTSENLKVLKRWLGRGCEGCGEEVSLELNDTHMIKNDLKLLELVDGGARKNVFCGKI